MLGNVPFVAIGTILNGRTSIAEIAELVMMNIFIAITPVTMLVFALSKVKALLQGMILIDTIRSNFSVP